MNEENIKLSKDVLTGGVGLIAAAGYINNEGGQAIADAATELMEQGCGTLLIDLDGTRIINSIVVPASTVAAIRASRVFLFVTVSQAC